MDGFFGAPLIGAIYMPINFRLIAGDFAYILNHAEAKILIVEDWLAPAIEEIRPQLKSVQQFIVATDGTDIPAGGQSYDRLLYGASAVGAEPAGGDEKDKTAILFTSGTTGKPKSGHFTHP